MTTSYLKPDAWTYDVDRGNDYGPFTEHSVEEPLEAEYECALVRKMPLYLEKPFAEAKPEAWMYNALGEGDVSFSSTNPDDGYGDKLVWSKPLYAPPLHKEVEKLTRENQQLTRLFDVQRRRSGEAGDLWRAAHPGNDLVNPDLGELLAWLIKRGADADRLRDENDTLLRNYAIALRHHEKAGREARSAAEAARAEADVLRNSVEFTLTDGQRLLRVSDVEEVCPHVEDCFYHSDTVRCGPCGIRRAAALGVATNEGIPNLPEVSRLRRALAASERELDELRAAVSKSAS